MQSKDREQKAQRIEMVAALLRQRLSGAGAEPVERFLRQYYVNVAPEDVLGQSAENLYGAALSLWKFAECHASGEAEIRVYNPSLEEHGWHSPHTIVEVVNDDMPFLVDSVRAEFERRGLAVHLMVHPVLHFRRDKDGNLIEFLDEPGQDDGAVPESLMHVEVSEQTQADALEAIREGVHKVLDDVRATVDDWRPMLRRLDEATQSLDRAPASFDPEEVAETRAFLEWLADNHFTLLGYREYDYKGKGGESAFKIVKDSGLGVLRDPSFHVLVGAKGLSAVTPQVLEFLKKPELMIVTKTNMRATVHRRAYMDYIGIKRFDGRGQVIGERRFIGLFTSIAYNQSPRYIPFLRRKMFQSLAKAGMAPEGHDGKALVNILEGFPRDELFQISEQELYETAMGILQLQGRPRIRLFVRRDKFGRFASCLVFVPRERYSTDLRRCFEAVLAAAYNGRNSAFYVQVGDAALARIHFIVGTEPATAADPVTAEVEAELVEAARSWEDTLYDALIEHSGEEKGNRLWSRYQSAFPVSYRELFNDQMALFDIARIEGLSGADDMAINLYRPIEEPEESVYFKIYHPGQTLALSDCLPMLEHLGFKVLEERPYRVDLSDGGVVWIHDLRMVEPSGLSVDLGALKDKFQDAFTKVWQGEIENDGFNRLVTRAGLGWREVVILRAYCKYLRQADITFSDRYLQETLVQNPTIARLLVDLFHTRFDPKQDKNRKKRAARIEREIGAELDAVEALDEDRILRRFLNLVQAMLRTNYYQRDAAGGHKPYISFKFASAEVAELPLPRPFVEIFVYSPRFEGIHMRGGRVARGGLRWSDRREDFRTEILGLMKAQMVKNAVIIPVGAKGGFVPKHLPAEGGRDAVQKEGIACYKLFVSGLLDITDNLKGGEVVPPAEVVRYDDDDPYLVVAADKGTATFSDIANGVARDYGFWLDDAFASGGSSGYDHKEMAITARGAWEAVKRHFREMGKDIQSEDFTVFGIGDMSGDVFGNGMLLSEHIKLVAAFDHRNIFIDPAPDAEKSWAERKRLYELPRSSWADYKATLLSKGGAVLDRKAKSVKPSPEAKALFGLERDSMTPNELIRALLKVPVDLMWLGGIGTYVKASHESDAEVGDRANDALRVDGRELKCRVIGEGANLGMTQLGRIEYATKGGRINVDAIDNSAGVDCSDHEVNIKVLLGAVVADGEMTVKQRDRLLAEMTEEVAALVLQDNYLQTQAISVAEAMGADLLEPQVRFMRTLEREGRLDRAVEFLPDDEALAERLRDRQAFTRPELSVLLAYSKMALYDDLLHSDVPEDPYLSTDLVKYFPRPLRKRFDKALQGHRLRREIIATFVANSMVNRAGITILHDIIEETGMAVADVARAYAVTRDAFGLRSLWTAIQNLDNQVPAVLQGEMILAARDLVQHATLWFLRNAPKPLDIAATIEAYRPGIAALEDGLEDFLGEIDAVVLADQRRHYQDQGVPDALARRIAALEVLASAPDIVLSAAQCARPVGEVACVYFAVGATLGLDWLRTSAERIAVESHWERLAVTAIVEDFYGQQRALTNVVLRAADGAAGEAAVAAWGERQRTAVERSSQLISEFKAAGGLDIPKLAIANRHYRTMIVGS